jgi:uncharacterized protein YndB with AHSA1/START domain
MSMRSTRHTTFVIERNYKIAVPKTFAAWTNADAKATWFFGPPDKWTQIKRELDFRIGGREFLSGSFKDGPTSSFRAQYQDIVPNERIVYSYDMDQDGKRISVSLATIEFRPSPDGTRLTFTEQAVFLDDFMDNGGRERGTAILLDQLGAALIRN